MVAFTGKVSFMVLAYDKVQICKYCLTAYAVGSNIQEMLVIFNILNSNNIKP